jgi:uncharacterized protein YjlB
MSLLAVWFAANGYAQQTIGNCSVLPADNIWNTAIDNLPVLSNSSSMVNTIGAARGFHADFGAGTWNGGPIGIPFVTVTGTQTKYPAAFLYADESDVGPYAMPLDAPIEGGSNSTGDRHAIAVDVDNCILYELYRAFPESASWSADAGAIFDLRSNALRPATWTSADAAGLPIMPGLVTYDEVASGEIRHAIRFTAPQTRSEFVWPARHYASSLIGTQYPRMGERFRLKANFDITPFTSDVQVILRAMKKYGIMLADNGSAWYISGAPDPRWNDDNLHTLGQLLGSNFEAVDAASLQIDPGSGAAAAPKRPVGDFDGDGKTDVAVYRPATGFWYILKSSTNFTSAGAYQWGLGTDIPVPGDYDGDGKADVAVYRPATGDWHILLSSTNFTSEAAYQCGVSTDIPVPGDYDGDGKTDVAVYRPTTGVWYILLSSTNFTSYAAYQWGVSTDIPVPGDYDGDGKNDVAVYRPATGGWFILKSSTNFTTYNAYSWGVSTDIPVPGDYDGDGKTDVAVYRPATGVWYILNSSTNFRSYGAYQWGVSTDIPVWGDFDGDGMTDVAVYRPENGVWYILKSSTNFTSYAAYRWGVSTDLPVLTSH